MRDLGFPLCDQRPFGRGEVDGVGEDGAAGQQAGVVVDVGVGGGGGEE